MHERQRQAGLASDPWHPDPEAWRPQAKGEADMTLISRTGFYTTIVRMLANEARTLKDSNMFSILQDCRPARQFFFKRHGRMGRAGGRQCFVADGAHAGRQAGQSEPAVEIRSLAAVEADQANARMGFNERGEVIRHHT